MVMIAEFFASYTIPCSYGCGEMLDDEGLS